MKIFSQDWKGSLYNINGNGVFIYMYIHICTCICICYLKLYYKNSKLIFVSFNVIIGKHKHLLWYLKHITYNIHTYIDTYRLVYIDNNME